MYHVPLITLITNAQSHSTVYVQWYTRETLLFIRMVKIN